MNPLKSGRKTYLLAALQGLAVAANLLGVLPPGVFEVISQLLGAGMLGTVAHKVVRETAA